MLGLNRIRTPLIAAFVVLGATFVHAQGTPTVEITQPFSTTVSNLQNPIPVTLNVNGYTGALSPSNFVARVQGRELAATFVEVGGSTFSFSITRAAVDALLGDQFSGDLAVSVVLLDGLGAEVSTLNLPVITVDAEPPMVVDASLAVLQNGQPSAATVFTVGATVRLTVTFDEEVRAGNPPTAEVLGVTVVLQEGSSRMEWSADIQVTGDVGGTVVVSAVDVPGNVLSDSSVSLSGAAFDGTAPVLTALPVIHISEVHYNNPEYVEVVNLGPAFDPTALSYVEGAGTKSIVAVSGSTVQRDETFVIVRSADSGRFNTQFASYSGPMFTTTATLNNTGDSVSLELGGSVLDSFSYSSTTAAGNSFHVGIGSSVTESAHSPGTVPFLVPVATTATEISRTVTASEPVSIASSCSITPATLSGTAEVTFTLPGVGTHTCQLTGTDGVGLVSGAIEYVFTVEAAPTPPPPPTPAPTPTPSPSPTPSPDPQPSPDPGPTMGQLTGQSPQGPTRSTRRYSRNRISEQPSFEYREYVKLFDRRVYYPENITGNYYLGDTDPNVGLLQSFLVRGGYLSVGFTPNLFGVETADALRRFKEEQSRETLGVTGLPTATGNLDTVTRELVNRLRREEFERIISNILRIHIQLLLRRVGV